MAGPVYSSFRQQPASHGRLGLGRPETASSIARHGRRGRARAMPMLLRRRRLQRPRAPRHQLLLGRFLWTRRFRDGEAPDSMQERGSHQEEEAGQEHQRLAVVVTAARDPHSDLNL
ncbi:hypothetical protein VPH35_067345 [Triticum aestivum]